jgi:hypothetical protein
VAIEPPDSNVEHPATPVDGTTNLRLSVLEMIVSPFWVVDVPLSPMQLLLVIFTVALYGPTLVDVMAGLTLTVPWRLQLMLPSKVVLPPAEATPEPASVNSPNGSNTAIPNMPITFFI